MKIFPRSNKRFLSNRPLSYCAMAAILFTIYIPCFSNEITKSDINSFLSYIWEHNPSVQAAISNVDAVGASLNAANLPLYNPSVEFEGESIREHPHEDTYTLELQQTIDLFNKRGARAQVAHYGVKKEQERLKLIKISVGIQALRALGEYYRLKEIAELAAKRARILNEFVHISAKRFKSGDLGQSDVDQARLSYSEAISEQAEADIALIDSKQKLEAITDIDYMSWPKLQKQLPSLPKSINSYSALALQTPLLKMISKRVKGANAQVNANITNTYADPTIGLRGGVDDKNTVIGIRLSLPLYFRNNYTYEVNQARSKLTAVTNEKEALLMRVKADLKGSYNKYSVQSNAYRKWEANARKSLIKGNKLLNKLWKAREIDTTSYLIQVKQRIDVEITGVELYRKAWESWFDWLEVSGDLLRWSASMNKKGR